MPAFTAPYVFPVSSAPIANGLVEVTEEGTITAVREPRQVATAAPAPRAPEKIDGVIIPGFVNAHCHLELSHLAGRSHTGKTLLPFLVDVVTLRETDREVIEQAIVEQDRLMWACGIQAVGDICNKADTAAIKRRSRIRYHSFVEMFDFLQPARARESFDLYHRAYREQPEPKSAVPHAPYTVSDRLYELIRSLNPPGVSVSIHNQETAAEDELFLHGTGDFHDFFASFGADLSHFAAPGTASIYHAMGRMDARQRTLFVHNTLTSQAAIAAAEEWGRNGVYWVTCPNANLYIENRLPRYARFLEARAKVCIGTDSLTSNWQLSILEEMRTISRYQSFLPFAELLKWATLNGAEALQFDGMLGSIEAGKQPGLLALEGLGGNGPNNFRITEETRVRRLV